MRYLFYSHDSYGLGHIRRTLLIAGTLLARDRDGVGLVVSGSARAHHFEFPPRCEYLKIPSVTKNSRGRYVARTIDLDLEQIVSLREALIKRAARSFRPDVLLVDHTPVGLCGEIRPLLGRQSDVLRGTARLLGMRDLIDEPAKVRRAWRDGNIYDCLRCYDRILVYGQQDFFDPIREYAIPDDIARRMVFTGYLRRNGARRPPGEWRAAHAPRTGRLVALTLGGGGDGYPLARSLMEGLEARRGPAPFELLIVTGPLMSPRKRGRLAARAARLEGVHLQRTCDDLPSLYSGADLVVAMAGYNTVCELASAGARVLLVPRVRPRLEQWMRSRQLADRGVVELLHPDEASPAALIAAVERALERPTPPRGWGLRLTGLETIGQVIVPISGPTVRRGGPSCEAIR